MKTNYYEYTQRECFLDKQKLIDAVYRQNFIPYTGLFKVELFQVNQKILKAPQMKKKFAK